MLKNSLFTLCLALVVFGCSSESFVFDYDYDFKGDFRAYKSYTFMTNSSSEIGAVEEQILKNIVEKRFRSMGYQHVDETPDILVAYKFHYVPTKIKGFSQYSLNSWLLKSSVDVADHSAENYVRKEVYLPAGSFSIYFVDAKTNRMIWQGYSGQDKPWSHEEQLMASISRVMDQYQVIAY